MCPLHVIPASQFQPRPVSWLWPYRLALGKPALLEGDPGLGKSLLALDLAARLSTGRPWPDGSAGPGPASAIIFNGEDNAEDTLLPRLQALGADLSRVHLPDRRGNDLALPLWLPAQVGALDEALACTGARLVVIDPIMAFLDPRVLTASDQSVRRALAPLAELAARHSAAILLVRHLRKAGAGNALYRGGGSIGFVAACRSTWLAARDPREEGRCLLAQVKNNLAPPQPTLAYAVQTHDNAAPTLTWLGESRLSADQLQSNARVLPRQSARDFLKDLLAKGPPLSADVWSAAGEQGFSPRTLYRAKRALGIRVVRVKAGGSVLNYWLLPGQQLPAALPPDAVLPDLEEWLEPLREQFPPTDSED